MMPAMTKQWSCLLALLVLLMPALAFAEAAAKVVFVTGSPTVTVPGAPARPLVRGSELQAGDTINTLDGQVQLRFADGASMSLKPGSNFRIDAFRFVDRGNRASSGDGVVMTLIKGAMRTITGLLGKEDYNQYRVGTSVATIGVRGTEYGAVFDGTGLAVTTYAGRVEVCSDAGCQQIGPGETVWVYERNQRPQFEPRNAAIPGAAVQPDLPQAPTVVNVPVSGGSPTTTTADPMSASRSPITSPSGK